MTIFLLAEDAMDRIWGWRAAILIFTAPLASASHFAAALEALPQGGQTCIAIVLPSGTLVKK